MLLKPNGNVVEGMIVTPDGEMASKPTVILTKEDAEVMRGYKKLLQRYGLREALYCQDCWSKDLSDGCKAFVTNEQVLIECRCRMRFYQGQTF